MNAEIYEEGVVCALSGIVPTDEEMDTALMGDDDIDAPVGWTQITITTKNINPKYALLIDAKTGLMNSILSGIEDEAERAASEIVVALQIDAQFAALEQSPAYAPTLVESQTLYLAPAENSASLQEATKELFDLLGIEVEEAKEVAVSTEEEAQETPEEV